MALPRKKLGEILVEMKAIDEMQLQAALGHQQQWGKSIGAALVEKGFCTSAQVLEALTKQSGYPAVDLDAQQLDSRLAFVLPVKTAEKYRAVPLRLEGKRQEVLAVALSGSTSIDALDSILAVSGKSRVLPHVAMQDAVDRAIARLYYGKMQPGAAPLKSTVATKLEAEAIAPESAPAPPEGPRPVLLYGWREDVSRALVASLAKSQIPARVATDEDVLAARPEDVIVSTTLALGALTPSGEKLRGQLVVAGTVGDEDIAAAKALGANVYLRAPLNAEQLLVQVRKCRESAAKTSAP